MPKKQAIDELDMNMREAHRAELRKIAAEMPDDMRLVRFQVKDVLKIKFVDLAPTDDVIVIGGKNGQGKSSLIKSIAYLLCGGHTLPTDVIRMGQTTASITGQVGPFTVRRRFDRRGKQPNGRFYITQLQVWLADGTEVREPGRGFLKLLLDHFTFDPTAFLRMKPEEQFEQMRKMAQIDLDLDAHDAAYKEIYDARHDKRIEWTALLNRLAALPEVPADAATVTPADVERLTRELENAAAWNEKVRQQRDLRENLRTRASNAEAEAEMLRDDAIALLEKAEKLDGNVWLTKEQNVKSSPCEAEELWEAASKVVVGDEVDTAILGAQLREAQALLAAQGRAAQRAEVAAEAAAAEAAWNALDEQCKANRERRERAMREAVLPVPHLVMGEGELFYKGMPFDQASGSEQLRVSLAIGMAANPKVKILRFLDGGWDMLDEKSQQMVRKEVAKHNYQLWAEHVGSGPGATIVMVDGEAKS